ncbi:hypothetical protein E8M12_10760 [Thalassotalea mangrovi]|uniref:DUF4870 domain-containing protein n=2 Tax=Thalassotalea mangrovi TaxID=2572245 RepID=A0A4U1B439_9GAMM|nr:hypothetical protein E8M12_10760 [Thalassotalea mangrovi]
MIQQKPINKHGKNVAIIAYFTIIGWIIALLMFGQKPTRLAAFHLRQSLGLFLTGVVLSFIPLIGWILVIPLLVLWLIGLIQACEGEAKPLPMVGNFYQQTLRYVI